MSEDMRRGTSVDREGISINGYGVGARERGE